MSKVAESLENALKSGAAGADQYIPGLSQVEGFFTSVGLGSGPLAPAGRFAFGFLVTAGLQKLAGGRYAGWAYDEQDEPRPWTYGGAIPVFENEDGQMQQVQTTSVPWWMLPSAVGTIVGVFI